MKSNKLLIFLLGIGLGSVYSHNIQAGLGEYLATLWASANGPFLEVNFTLSEIQKVLSHYPEKTRRCHQIVPYAVFEQLMDQFAAVHRHTTNKAEWLNDVKPSPEVYNLNSDKQPYAPYVQKIAGLGSAEIAFFGDLHGSAHSLTRSFVRLRDEGYLDNNFKIIKDNFYIVLIGDYIDDGVYGIETLYLAMRLKIANPDRALCLRGNHEGRYAMKKSFFARYLTFRYEIHTKWPLITKAQEQKIDNFFGLLPLAVYFGFGDAHKMEYVQCCHAGLELGYCPKDLFSNHKASFELINKLKRATYAKKLSPDMQRALRENLASDQLLNVIQTSPQRPVTNQLSWAYFAADDSSMQTVSVARKKHRSWIIGESFAREMLALAETNTAYIRTIFRGHEHPIGKTYLGYHVRWNGLVNTVFSQSKKLGYDSFVILNASKDKAEWSIDYRVSHF